MYFNKKKNLIYIGPTDLTLSNPLINGLGWVELKTQPNPSHGHPYIKVVYPLHSGRSPSPLLVFIFIFCSFVAQPSPN